MPSAMVMGPGSAPAADPRHLPPLVGQTPEQLRSVRLPLLRQPIGQQVVLPRGLPVELGRNRPQLRFRFRQPRRLRLLQVEGTPPPVAQHHAMVQRLGANCSASACSEASSACAAI